MSEVKRINTVLIEYNGEEWCRLRAYKQLQAENEKLKKDIAIAKEWLADDGEAMLKENEKLKEICVATYLCFHVSERCTMYKPVQEAWDIGQKIYDERKLEGKAL
ncbi:MAG: hypothetical protein GY861_01815 [bacterium]|nr:hypothetical protein [bacterium]